MEELGVSTCAVNAFSPSKCILSASVVEDVSRANGEVEKPRQQLRTAEERAGAVQQQLNEERELL
jgi:hypothetical protein